MKYIKKYDISYCNNLNNVNIQLQIKSYKKKKNDLNKTHEFQMEKHKSNNLSYSYTELTIWHILCICKLGIKMVMSGCFLSGI